MLTVLEIIKRTTEFFTKRGVESARLNAELLIGHALGLKRMQLYLQFERPLAEAELENIRPLVKRRGNREPLQHILGETEFAGVKLRVDRRALIPRPETEYLVELVGVHWESPPARILDLGTGSGALALALAVKYPAAQVMAVEQDPAALALAAENVASLGLATRVELVASNWFGSVPAGAKFELIVANPPYLTPEEVREAEPEVRDYDPITALTPGPDAASDLKKILAGARPFLAPGGMLACETGRSQRAVLEAAAAAAGWARVQFLPDLTGRERFVLAFV